MKLVRTFIESGWGYLCLAGVFEIIFATLLKMIEGFTKPIPSALFVISLFISFYLLTKSIEKIPLGTAYAVWTGIGVIGTVIVGIVYYKESATMLKMLFLITLISSIIGLKFTSAG
jgi:quaternary ammonium compound-resistance protein SugE